QALGNEAVARRALGASLRRTRATDGGITWVGYPQDVRCFHMTSPRRGHMIAMLARLLTRPRLLGLGRRRRAQRWYPLSWGSAVAGHPPRLDGQGRWA